NRRANQLAHYLRSLGVGPDVRVGLCVERSLDLVVGILGILKAGGAYVPLDPQYPEERLAFLIRDSQAPVLLTQQSLRDRLPAHAATTICLDADWQLLARFAETNPDCQILADNLCYLIYTSGSTGQPKGVQITHANVTRLLDATAGWFHFDAQDVWTLFHSAAFDFSVWEIWGALAYGGRLVVVPYWVSRDPQAFYALVRSERVTVLNQTPSAFRQLIQADAAAPADDLALRYVIFGGEALELQSLRPWFERHGDERPQLVNMYGITETTVHVTYRPIAQADLESAPGSVIGGPIPDLQLYVLDPAQHLVPIGVPGELYVAGAGVARGYLNRPALTAERFIPDPFANIQGSRLYRTGDLARYLPNGDLEYLGRVDQQVKVRGFRIELGEIEAALAQHPGVREAIVVVRGDEAGGDKRLVAYVVKNLEPRTENLGENKEQRNKGTSEQNSSPSPAATEAEARRGSGKGEAQSAGGEGLIPSLRTFLGARLPAYMVPAAFVLLDALPLTAHGKLDRRALPEPDADRALGETTFVPPSTPTEDILAAIWSRVLGVDRIGIDDNFFALGGDSIRSIQILALARERGLHFSLPELFQHQTIRVLARELQHADADAASAEQSRPFSLIAEADRARMPESVEDAYPLTQLQAGMLFHSEYSAESAVYHNVNTLRLQGRFDGDALQAATRQLTTRHTMLRTAFDLTSFSRPLQLVQRHAEIPIRIMDLRALPPDRQEQELAAWFEAERRQKFDWTHAPLIRFQVHLRSDDTFQFSWSEHHAILDGWSVASLLTELFQEYARYGDETIVPPAPPTSSFRDFVALEQAALNSQAEQSFWLEQMQDATMTRVPRWPARAAGSALDAIDVPIAPELSQALKRVAREAAVPIKTVLLAAHLRVMALLGGSSDVLTGVVANGRPETVDGERVLGLFLNTLPLRQRLSGGTWRELVRATFAAEQQILAHRRYPMAEVQRLLGGQPLFETMFNFVHFHVYERLHGVGDLAVLDSRAFAQTNFTLSADFSLDLTTTDVRLAVSCNPDEIGTEQLHAIAAYYAQALTALALTPDSRYETASLLSAAERQALLHDWNATAVPYPSGTVLHELIEAQVQRTPDATALVFEAGTRERVQLTYHELNRRANQLAHYLRALGIQPEDRIAICVERSFELIVGILGILKAGGAYTPIDPTLPIERQRFILEDTRAAVLVTQQRLAAALPEHEAYSVYLDSDSAAIAQMPDTNPPCVSKPNNLAYIIYTSGSTGRPKGVMIPHGNLVSMYSAWEETYQLKTAVRRHLQMANVTFDVFAGDLVRALCSGGTLVLCPRELLLAPDQLYNLIRCEQIDSAEFVPVVLRPLLQYLRESNQLLDGMRLLVCGSDSWSMEEFDQVRQVCGPNTRVVNSFGVTEATIDSTWYDSTQPTCAGDQWVPIGRPFGNTRAYILDLRCQLLPVGVPGELYLGGAGLARGYLNRPDLTADKFIPDPFAQVPGARLYKTGDLARFLPDGTIEFLGRLDHQVKLRGFRVELGEIEATLRQHPAVGEAVVVVREDSGDKRLVAYVVGEQGNKGTKEQENLELRTENQGDDSDGSRSPGGHPVLGSAELRQWLGARLPDYMVPSVVVVLDVLPLTPSGKIDRRALPAPEWSAIVSDQPFIAPRTPVEEVVANVWADVLGLARVGRDDNFFALGGHSLLATQVISRLRQTFGIDLPLRSLFDTPTVPGLAEQIEVARRHVEQIPSPPLQPIARDQELPLSFAQQRLWFLDQLNPGHSFYNMYVAVRLTGALDVSAVERSLNAIVQRHEALRTTIAPMNGNPVQVIHANLPIPLPIVDLRDLPAAEREAEALRLAAVEGDQPFDLAQGSLLRARLLRLDDEQHIVLLTMHHIVSDGWSMGMLVRELVAFYTAFTATGDSSVSQLQLAPLPVQYADFAAWQRQMLQDQVLDRQLSYWKNQLIDLPILDLPTDRPRPPLPTFGGATELFALDQELSTALLALSRREGVTLFMTLLAGFQAVLARYSGQDDIVVGSPIAGRTRPELEGLIGFFVNMLVLRTDLRGAPTARQLLARVREVCLQAYAHQDLPFEMLVEELQPERNLSYNPLFQVGFALQNTPLDVLELPGLTISQIQVSSETAKFDLSVFLSEEPDGIGGLIEYNTDLFDAATIRRLIDHFRTLLAGMVAAPDQPVLTLPILSAAECDLFAAWNTTAREFPPQPVSQIFEAQAGRTPDAIAVQFDDQRLSYAE
ncbi:MAG TPA: amino acid adenylation domain-containing protein, partial [Herpetosiphonaceae bacterium]